MSTKRPTDRSSASSSLDADAMPAQARPGAISATEILDLGNVQDADGDTAEGWTDSILDTDQSEMRQSNQSGWGWDAVVAPDLVEDDSGESRQALDWDDGTRTSYDRLMTEDESA